MEGEERGLAAARRSLDRELDDLLGLLGGLARAVDARQLFVAGVRAPERAVAGVGAFVSRLGRGGRQVVAGLRVSEPAGARGQPRRGFGVARFALEPGEAPAGLGPEDGAAALGGGARLLQLLLLRVRLPQPVAGVAVAARAGALDQRQRGGL